MSLTRIANILYWTSGWVMLLCASIAADNADWKQLIAWTVAICWWIGAGLRK